MDNLQAARELLMMARRAEHMAYVHLGHAAEDGHSEEVLAEILSMPERAIEHEYPEFTAAICLPLD